MPPTDAASAYVVVVALPMDAGLAAATVITNAVSFLDPFYAPRGTAVLMLLRAHLLIFALTNGLVIAGVIRRVACYPATHTHLY